MKKSSCYMILFALSFMLLCGCAGVPFSDVQQVPQDDVTESVDMPAEEDSTAEGDLGFTVIPATEEEEQETPPVDPVEEKVQALLSEMSLEERVAQMFFVRCPESGAVEALSQYALGGYILFASNLSGLTEEEVRSLIGGFQENAKIPLLIGTDEEGGTVVRVSSNPNLRESKFQSPRDLLGEGGIDLLISDTREKSQLLLSLGINVNLAPVCDLSDNPDDFIYDRSMGGDAETVSDYVTQMVEAMQEEGIGSVLKHFPGYGNCADTHEGIVIDHRVADDFLVADLLPFEAGAANGAGGVLVCHNIVEAFDEELPASLSPAVHELLREKLGNDIVVMTDDLDMDGITEYTDGASAAVQAVVAGNDLLLLSDYETGIRAVLDAVEDGTVTEERINESVSRILTWKIALGLIEA